MQLFQLGFRLPSAKNWWIADHTKTWLVTDFALRCNVDLPGTYEEPKTHRIWLVFHDKPGANRYRCDISSPYCEIEGFVDVKKVYLCGGTRLVPYRLRCRSFRTPLKRLKEEKKKTKTIYVEVVYLED